MNRIYLIIVGLLVMLSGCEIYESYETPLNYYLTSEKDVRSFGRVALIELRNETAVPEVSINFSEALYQELLKKQMFGVMNVPEDDATWRSLQLKRDAEYTFDQLLEMRKTLKCNAVIVGSVTSYKSYPHMAVGVELRMIDLTDGQMLWALEQVWDTTDKPTGHRMRKYYGDWVIGTDEVSVIGPESPNAQLGFVSALKFLKFVAYEASGTFEKKTEKNGNSL
ncbi:MAG: hypothetical protein ACYSUT_05875 [Planctomycetota bacterium]